MKFYSGAFLVLTFLISGCSSQDEGEVALLCHVGGTMRPVFEKLVDVYEKDTGQAIEINAAGSGELLANIQLLAEGDLYVSHDPFLDLIMAKDLAVNGWSIGEIVPVIIVQKGNPKNIGTLDDFLKDDVQLALTDYRLSTLGRMLPFIFGKAGIDIEAMTREKNIIIHRSGSYVANLVALKNADAALVWGAVATLRDDVLDAIPIRESLPTPYVDTITSATGISYTLSPVRVTICSLKCSKRSADAERFIQFLMTRKARNILESYGFGVDDELRKQEYKNSKKLSGQNCSA